MQARQTRIAFHMLTAALVIASLLAGSIGSALAQSNPNGPVRDKPGRFLDICAPVDQQALQDAYVFRYGVTGDKLQADFYNSEDSYNADGFRPARSHVALLSFQGTGPCPIGPLALFCEIWEGPPPARPLLYVCGSH